MDIRIIFLLLLFIFSLGLFAQRGKDGDVTISGTQIINEYTSLAFDANIGDNEIIVADAQLNTNNRFATNLQAGDLILIIQMQGASIVPDVQNTTYGEITNYQSCGLYEYIEVAGVPNNSTITLSCALTQDYTVSGHTQIIRIPRYNSMQIPSGAELSVQVWDGSIGGVLAIEVLGNTEIEGIISADGAGFRGGELDDETNWGIGEYYLDDNTYGAEKGEGIAGYHNEYDNYGGRYCRGAAANGGGGGNAQNAGGGGGANAGDIANWTGKGIPDTSDANWIIAWNLEVPNFAYETSSGGGRGGYSYSGNERDALVLGPNNHDWGGDRRNTTGGLGGRPLDYTTGRLFLGGGGGAGDQNDGYGGAGGNGGGLIMLLSYGEINGNGTITTNGANGQNAEGTGGITELAGRDGAGGGGSGGTVFIQTTQPVENTITINAIGGKGGDQLLHTYFGQSMEAEGPGGGGSGGYISISQGNPTISVLGGNNGVTNSDHLTEFPPNGATKGGIGIFNTSAPVPIELIGTNDTICLNQQATLIGSNSFGYAGEWYDSPAGGQPIANQDTFITPVLTQSKTYYYTICPGNYRIPVEAYVAKVAINISQDMTICDGASINLSASGGQSYNWTPTESLTNYNTANPTAQPDSTTIYTVSVTNVYGCIGRDSVKVTVGDSLVINIGKDTAICPNDTLYLQPNIGSGTTFSWSPVNSLSNPDSANIYVYPVNTTIYTLNVSDNFGCTGKDSIIVTVYPLPNINAGSNQGICPNDSITISATGGIDYNWQPSSNIQYADSASALVYPNTSRYYYVYASDANGCFGYDSIFVEVYTPPTANFQANNTCFGDTVSFINNSQQGSSAIQSYQWNFGDGNTATNQNPKHLYNDSTLYNINLIIIDNNGCSDTANNQIQIYDLPQIVYQMQNTEGCEPLSVEFANQSNNSNTVLWNLGDGTQSTENNFTHTYADSGNYTVTLHIESSNGCVMDSVLVPQIIVNPKPNANFQITPSSGVDISTTVLFEDASIYNIAAWNWYFGNGDTSIYQNPTYLYPTPGNYSVTLIVQNSFGCFDTITKPISVEDVININAPNIITPNNDGINDYLIFDGLITSKNNKLTIYNRWGNIIFESPKYINNWNAAGIADGVYFYILELENSAPKHGSITINR